MAERMLLAVDLKAVKERWPITEEDRADMVARALEIVRSSKSARTRVMAQKILVAMDQLNILDKKVGYASEPKRHFHVHTTEPNPKIIDAQANLVAALAEAGKDQATKPSEIVGEPVVEGI